VTFTLPDSRFGAAWEMLFNTAVPAGEAGGTVRAGRRVELAGRSIVVLRGEKPG
jgi:hypothetical protein